MDDYTMDRKEFERAVNNGLGRAKLYVQKNGLNKVRDLVKTACLHNHAFDPQVEESRAKWLLSLFQDSAQYPNIRQSIFDALSTEKNYRDFIQLLELTKEMALKEDLEAKNLLRARILEYASQHKDFDWKGNEIIIEVWGDKGFVDLARVYGARLLENPDQHVNPWLVLGSENKEKRLELLRMQAQTDMAIQAFTERFEESGQKAKPKVNESSASSTLQETVNTSRHKKKSLSFILECARLGKGEFPGFYTVFGINACDEDLERIWSQFQSTNDVDEQVRLLWVFRRKRIPHEDKRLFSWARGLEGELRRASIAALSQIRSNSVRNLALEKLEAKELANVDDEALGLFILNYEQGDETQILETLKNLESTPEEIHSQCFDLLSLADKHLESRLGLLLQWVYENVPCTNCRFRAVKLLEKIGELPDKIREECQFDADSELVEWAKSVV